MRNTRGDAGGDAASAVEKVGSVTADRGRRRRTPAVHPPTSYPDSHAAWAMYRPFGHLRKRHRLPRRAGGGSTWVLYEALDALHVGGVEPLCARLDLEFHLLTLSERLEPVHRDCREVDEDVLAPLLFNEAVPLCVIEPLHFPSGHCALPPT